MKVLIKNGRVVDPANGINAVMDILVDGAHIAKVAKNITAAAGTTIDAGEKIVMPGIVDMHVHLREPGGEDKETVASGTRAALKGAVTSVLAMPNTMPPIDNIEQVRRLKDIIKKSGLAHVLIAAAITRGQCGLELVDIPALKKEGVTALTDDGFSVDSDEVMLEALKKSKKEGLVVIVHCEDRFLSRQGVVNLGTISTQLGLQGIPKEAEYKRVDRDIRLAEKADAAIHIAHVSCLESVELVAKAKKKGLRVTAEATPHHFSFDEESVLEYDTNMKMNPPLRSRRDVEALKQGLKDGVIDVIASDHAPHTENQKEIEFDRAAFGVIGLETELAAAITELVMPGILDWGELVRKVALNPAKILKTQKGTLGKGCEADIVIINPDQEWKVAKAGFASKSKNSSFLGRVLKGVVEYTICAGNIAYQRDC